MRAGAALTFVISQAYRPSAPEAALKRTYPMWLRNPASFLLIALASLAAYPAAASGQACTSDSQCAPPGFSRTATCQGTLLVTRERLCLGGHCSDSVARRIECGGGSGHGNCDPIAGQCRGTGGGASVSNLCPPRCICRGQTLIVVTGKRGTGRRCETEVTTCAGGCSCTPGPHCVVPPRRR